MSLALPRRSDHIAKAGSKPTTPVNHLSGEQPAEPLTPSTSRAGSGLDVHALHIDPLSLAPSHANFDGVIPRSGSSSPLSCSPTKVSFSFAFPPDLGIKAGGGHKRVGQHAVHISTGAGGTAGIAFRTKAKKPLSSSSSSAKSGAGSKNRKGPWTPQEDDIVRRGVDASDVTSIKMIKWSNLASLVPGRTGKQVRERRLTRDAACLGTGSRLPGTVTLDAEGKKRRQLRTLHVQL